MKIKLRAALLILCISVSFAPTVRAQTQPPAAAQMQPAPATPLPAAQAPDAQLAPARIPRELSPWSMFMSADILVKAVMMSLAFASLVTWTIFLGKTLQLLLARRRVQRRARHESPRSRTLAGSAARARRERQRGRVAARRRAATSCACRPTRSPKAASRSARSRASPKSCAPRQRVARIGMGLLATIGSTAPFVGLFGTVWGIMNSFIGISKAQTTNLAVVAPGIAEALLATAIGLVAAIPAVIFYNHFARGSKGYLELVSRAVRRGRAAAVARSRPRRAAACSRAPRSERWRASLSDLDDDDEFGEAHEINVTPFIDVMLVLLIIFMIAAPLSTVDLPVDLPSSTATPQKKPDKPTYVTIKSDLAVAIGETQVKRVDLVQDARRRARTGQGPPHLPARRHARCLTAS